MQTFDCLNKETPIFSRKLLEASAGTGKTFAIEHLFVRLLLESKEEIFVDQILVVTFTNKATQELKNRIFENLHLNLSMLKGQSLKETFDYLSPFLMDEEKKQIAILRLENAIHFFELSSIFTLHSFCFRILKEFYLSANLQANLKIDNTIKQDIRLFEEFLQRALDERVLPCKALEWIIQKYPHIDKLYKKINSINSKEASLETIYKKFFSEALTKEAFSNEQIKEGENILSCFKKSLKISVEEINQKLILLNQIFINKEVTPDLFVQFCYKLEQFLSYFSLENAKKSFSGSSSFLSVIDFLKDKFLVFFKILFEEGLLLRDLAYHFDQYKKKQSDSISLSYDDILQKTQQALLSSDFVLQVQNKFQAVIVDEFQDTDPIQWQILETIFFHKNDLKALYLVGDPKQSIYSFRNADLYTYLHVSQLFNKDELGFLDINYRSTHQLIDTLNALFSYQGWLKLPKKNESLFYHPVKAHYLKKNERQSDCFLWLAEEKNPLSRDLENSFYSRLIQEIIKLKKEDQIDYNQMAVLVRDRFQAERVKSFLQKQNLPVICKSQAGLQDTESFQSLKEVFQAILYPKDFNKILLVLIGPYFQIPTQKIKNLSDEDKNNILFLFHQLHKKYCFESMEAFFHAFFKMKIFSSSSVLENITTKEKLHLYFETLDIIEKLYQEKPSSILSFFENKTDTDEDRGTVFEENGISIMTIHLSKGLEYEAVFAFGLMNRSNPEMADSEKVLEIDAEKMRQLYVALTRAKKKLYIPFVCDTYPTFLRPSEASPLELFLSSIIYPDLDTYQAISFLNLEKIQSFFQPLVDKHLLEIERISDTILPISANSEVKTKELFLPSVFNQDIPFQSFLSFSSLSQHDETTFTFSEKVAENELPPSAKTGIFMHRLLEEIFKDEKLLNSFETRKAYLNRYLPCTEFGAYQKRIQQILKEVFEITLKPKSFCLQDLKAQNCFTEMEFLYPFQENLMKGFMDLVFIHEGAYYIIDWKTNFLGSGQESYSQESLEKEMHQKNYFLQAKIYVEALKRYCEAYQKPFQLGGVFYIFLRGLDSPTNGIYYFVPEANFDFSVSHQEVLWKD